LYSLEQDKLIWAGLSRTVDPTKIDRFITELANAVTYRMKQTGSSKHRSALEWTAAPPVRIRLSAPRPRA